MGIKVSFDLRKMRVDLEGEGKELISVLEAVKAAAPAFEEVRLFGPGKMPDEGGTGSGGDSAGAGTGGNNQGGASVNLGLRPFAKGLTLDSHFIKIAAIAFHQREHQGKGTFSAKEMDSWFGLCGFQKPRSMAIALSDTQRRKEYIENSGRDQWKLTTVGENAVRQLMGQ